MVLDLDFLPLIFTWDFFPLYSSALVEDEISPVYILNEGLEVLNISISC
jgi:hypothetical protein